MHRSLIAGSKDSLESGPASTKNSSASDKSNEHTHRHSFATILRFSSRIYGRKEATKRRIPLEFCTKKQKEKELSYEEVKAASAMECLIYAKPKDSI